MKPYLVIAKCKKEDLVIAAEVLAHGKVKEGSMLRAQSNTIL